MLRRAASQRCGRYRPTDRTPLPRVLSAVRGRSLVIPGKGGCRTSLTCIGNLADAVLLACAPTVPAGVYNIADSSPVVIEEALSSLMLARGQDVRIRHLPIGIAAPLASVSEAAFRLLRRPQPPPLTRYAISHLAMDRTLNLDRARSALGYRPRPKDFSGAANW